LKRNTTTIMINCLIVDDEAPAIKIISSYIEKVPYLQLSASTTNPLEGLKLANEKNIELIFLDIQMPGLTGLEFVEALNGKCKVIFVTAYSNYALEGFELGVLDYLLKPVSFTRFLKATQKVQDVLQQKAENKQANNDFLVVKGDGKGKFTKIELEEIDYIQGDKNYISIYCGDKRTMTLMNMKDIEDSLPASKFVRVHKSLIVAISNIKAVEGNSLVLKRSKGVEAIIGMSYKDAFLEMMKSKMVSR
jgi:two-component system, LytTR family, response regulator